MNAMRKRLLPLLAILVAALPGTARERLFVTTDRPAYIAGDLVCCSLFCVDETGRRSQFSAVSYLELLSADGTVAEAKIGLFSGRGAGTFRIPAHVPTGTYRLVAYTADAQPDPAGSRLLSVFNTTGTSRVRDGVSFVAENDFQPFYDADSPAEGGLLLSIPARSGQGRTVTLLLDGMDQEADLSVSVYHEDGIAPSDDARLSTFLEGKMVGPGPRAAEYDGEIITATVEGLSAGQEKENGTVTAFLSTAGSPENVYIGRNDADGRIRFFTGNIYGDRELVCEVVSMTGKSCHINLSSPFLHPEPGPLPPLVLSPAQRDALLERKAALRSSVSQAADTLARFLPKREDLLLSGMPKVRYHLDDYTRFPSVQEICTEFIPELQFVRRDGRWRIRMIVTDGTASRNYLQDNILVMMDGVVLTDHGMLADFDALLLEDVDIYRQAVTLGGVAYNGLVNFISKKNYVTALRFPENVRVVDFKGISWPVAFPEGVPTGTEKDRRQLLYWHPALEIQAGTPVRIPLRMPAYAGRFRIVAEGWKADGTPVRAEALIEVE